MERARALYRLLETLPSGVRIREVKTVWVKPDGKTLKEVRDSVPPNSGFFPGIRLYLNGSSNTFSNLGNWTSITDALHHQEPRVRVQPFAVQKPNAITPHPEPHRGIGYSLVIWSTNPNVTNHEWRPMCDRFMEFGISVQR